MLVFHNTYHLHCMDGMHGWPKAKFWNHGLEDDRTGDFNGNVLAYIPLVAPLCFFYPSQGSWGPRESLHTHVKRKPTELRMEHAQAGRDSIPMAHFAIVLVFSFISFI